MTGFEPATTRTPCAYATRLRHIPKGLAKIRIHSKLKEVLIDIFRQPVLLPPGACPLVELNDPARGGKHQAIIGGPLNRIAYAIRN